MKQVNTAEAILQAAMTLFSQKGFAEVTTKEIARKAGVNEVTLFRHFGTKKGVLEAGFDCYVYAPNLGDYFKNKVSWDLEKDLLSLCFTFWKSSLKAKKVLLTELRNLGPRVGDKGPLRKFPNDLRDHLEEYFLEMKKRGIVKGDPKVLATNFICFNLGLFMSFSMVKVYGEMEMVDTCIRGFVKSWMEGITR